MPTPVALAQAQLDAYNARDIDAFCACFSDEVEVRSFPSGELLFAGMDAFRERYARRFESPGLHAEVVRRIAKDQVVIDEEHVVGIGEAPVHAVAMYHCGASHIEAVWFVT